MKHPFSKMFDTALRNSSLTDNVVLKEAERLKEKGYNVSEIYTVLLKLKHGLLDDKDCEVAQEATEEFEKYV